MKRTKTVSDSSPFDSLVKRQQFKIKTDDCGDPIVPGRYGNIYLYSTEDNLIGAMYIPDQPRKGWKNFKDKLLKAGAQVVQNGDMEGAVVFAADNGKAIRAACSILKIKSKRSLSPERRAAAAARLAEWREQQSL